MDTAKIYHDSDGNKCSIWQIVRREPDWAANRIQEGEKSYSGAKCFNKIEEMSSVYEL